jgi:hypothetical protein
MIADTKKKNHRAIFSADNFLLVAGADTKPDTAPESTQLFSHLVLVLIKERHWRTVECTPLINYAYLVAAARTGISAGQNQATMRYAHLINGGAELSEN